MSAKNTSERYLTVYCHVHMVSTCCGHAFAICDNSISGMIAASIAMRVQGMVGQFQTLIADFLRARLQIVRRPPIKGHVAFRYCRSVLNRCLGPESKKPGTLQYLRRCIIETWLSGDWSENVVTHYCDGTCCSCEEVTREAMNVVAWALMPHAIELFPRHRWTGAEQTLAGWLLPAA